MFNSPRWQNLPLLNQFLVLIGIQSAVLIISLTVGLLLYQQAFRRASEVEANRVEQRVVLAQLQRQFFSLATTRASLLDSLSAENVLNEAELEQRRQIVEGEDGIEAGLDRLRNLITANPDIIRTNNPLTINSYISELRTQADLSISQIEEANELLAALYTPEQGDVALLEQRLAELEAATPDTLSANLAPVQTLHADYVTQRINAPEGSSLLVEAATELAAFPNPEVSSAAEAYLAQLDQVEEGAAALRALRQGALGQQLALNGNFGRLSAVVLSGTAVNIGPSADASAAVRTNIAGVFVVLVLAVAVNAGLLLSFAWALIGNVRGMQAVTDQWEAGNFDERMQLVGRGEFGQLSQGLNAVATQLQWLLLGFEQRVTEAARNLGFTAEIGRAITTGRDPFELMNEVVNRIVQRFDFYHAQVFLVEGDQAVLIASTGPAGREMLARRHSLEVGSRSVIGQVTELGEPVVALDTDTSEVHRRNELLSETRSEMALPMRIGGRVIGALDIQSVSFNAFDDDDIAIFQIIADQLAIGLDNGRLYGQLEALQERFDALERQFVSRSWVNFQREQAGVSNLAYQLEAATAQPAPLAGAGDQALQEAVQHNRVVARRNGGGTINLALPIRIRGEAVGAFGFSGEHLADLPPEDLALVEAIVDRVGVALENMRLIRQTVRRAEHEEMVNEITSKIVGSTDVSQILQTAVKELGRILGAPQTTVQLRRGGLEDVI